MVSKSVATCDRTCLSCTYSCVAGGRICCIYILRENKRRPCPAGTGCTVFVPRDGVKKLPKLPKEEFLKRERERDKNRREKRKAERERTVICGHCGKSFITHDTRRRHCSEECSLAHYQEQQANRKWKKRKKEETKND